MENKVENIKDSEIDLLDYFNVLVKHRKMIVRNVIIVAFISIVISLILPKTYTGVATILPPEENQQAGILAALSNSPISSFIMNEAGTTSDLYVQILQSRTVLDGVLQSKYKYHDGQKKLLDIFESKSLEMGRIKLSGLLGVKATPEGIISVEVELKDRNLAADVANNFVTQLDKVNKEKNISRAKNSRVYIENQLKLTEKKLKSASEDLVKFKEKYKAISLEEQVQAAIENAAELKAQIIAQKVELGVALQTMKADNVFVVKLQKHIDELEKQYNYLQYGNKSDENEKKEFYIPFANVPGIGLDLANLLREVKVQETVWELLNQQYYHAKIQEARDTPTIQVLDEAVPPELRTKPKRKLIVIMGIVLSAIISLFGAFVFEYLEKVRSGADNETDSKIKSISGELKNDWAKLRVLYDSFLYRFHKTKKD